MGRLLSPRSIAFVGGSIAEMAIQRCVDMGYDGEIWPVNPNRDQMCGFSCYATVSDLPWAPDACFIGVHRELAIEIVSALSKQGAGGCVCYAAGFAEMGQQGQALQDRLVAAAGAMPLIGPNCFGFVNHLDRCALWPYLFGGKAVERGAALISQSGNIAMNLTMNARSLNFSHIIGAGNQACLGPGHFIDALLDDPRVTAIGMYIEGFDDLGRFCDAALRALQQRVPIVIMKVGKTAASSRQSSSHTSSLTGSDVLYDALFTRLGIIRVDSLNRLLETLMVLEHSKPLQGNNILSLSCSGGEAAIIADLAPEFGLEMKPFSATQQSELASQFTNYVTVSNPFDYNTSIWGDRDAQQDCFATAMGGAHDAAFLIYDHPTIDAEEVAEWVIALDAFAAAHKATGMPAFVVCTISELLPEDIRERLLADGVVPLHGLEDGLYAYAAASRYHCFVDQQAIHASKPRLAGPTAAAGGELRFLDEWESKRRLGEFGLTAPEGAVGSALEVVAIADRLGYPVVVKALDSKLLHKTELGAVMLNLGNSSEVAAAVKDIQRSVDRNGGKVNRFLVERMVVGGIAELIVGVKRDQQFGPALVIGAGGVLVELICDSVSLLLPTDRTAIAAAIDSLAIAKLLGGYRGKPPADKEAIVDAVLAVAAYAESEWDHLLELDINPLIVLPEGQGAVAADALIGLASEDLTGIVAAES